MVSYFFEESDRFKKDGEGPHRALSKGEGNAYTSKAGSVI